MSDRFVWPVRVYYEDTDFGGVVYYVNYLKFMERARTEHLRHLGIDQVQLRQERNWIFVVTDTQIQYKKPARFNDMLYVTSEITQRKRASMVFRQDIFRDQDGGELITTSVVGAACIHADTLRPQRIPEQIMNPGA